MTSDQPEQQQRPPVSVIGRCLNCGAELTGRYCANCSQAADVHVPSTPELLHQAREGITHSLLWSLPLYTVVAMRRVFGRSWAGTLVKAFALFAVYMVVLSITLAGVFLYAVLQL